MCDIPLAGNWVSFEEEKNLVMLDMEGAWKGMKHASKVSEITVSMIISCG